MSRTALHRPGILQRGHTSVMSNIVRSRGLLLGTASLAGLLAAQPAFAQTVSGMRGGAATVAAGASGGAGVPVTTLPPIAQAAIARQAAIKARVATATDLANQAQQAARSIALARPGSVPDGLVVGGLVVDPRVLAGSDPNLWVNASQPVQTQAGGQTDVTITQTAQRAILTWEQFNVGKNTLVHFDQTAGNSKNGNNWIALNRIDATGVPSRIEGQIKAEGTVLLINPNGVIFGAGSQVNTHGLIAAAMDINTLSFNGADNRGVFAKDGDPYAQIIVGGLGVTTGNGNVYAPVNEDNGDKAFLAGGLFTGPGITPPNSPFNGPSATFSAGAVPGQANAGVVVEAGATISTDINGFDNGGLVALLGPQVTNGGRIETQAGSILLGAGATVTMGEPAPATSATSFFLAGITQVGQTSVFYAPPEVAGGSFVINRADGELISHRGNVAVMGDEVEQDGLIEATTSITRAGSLNFSALGVADASNPLPGTVTFGSGSVTAILPEENGETIPSDATSLATFVAPTINVFTTSMDMRPDALIYAPGTAMTVARQPALSNLFPTDPLGRVLFEDGSLVDLSGDNVVRNQSDYLYTFKVTANDVADTPLAKNLIGQTVTIDLSLSGTRADGETWVGSPLFASSGAGYLANVTQGIDQLLTKAGSLTVGNTVTTVGTFSDVITAPGSTINVSGGSVSFRGGVAKTSQLLGADGKYYDIGSADPTLPYQRIVEGFQVDHHRWGVVDTYAEPLIRTGRYEDSYVNGTNGGSISLIATNPIVEGDIVADLLIGEQQRRGNAALPTGASLAITLMSSAYDIVPTRPDTAILDSAGQDLLGDGFGLDSELALPLDGAGYTTLHYSTDLLSSYGLGSIAINGADTLSVAQGAALRVLDGGKITLGEVSRVDGSLIAHAGTISLTGDTPFTNFIQVDRYDPLTIGATALLDVSGLWVNDTGQYSDAYQGAAFVNGGSISITTVAQSEQTGTNDAGSLAIAQDRTLSIQLDRGSVIDVSSGGHVGASGQLQYGADGMPVGKGGNLSLITYGGGRFSLNDISPFSPPSQNNRYTPAALDAANISMDGTIRAAGLSQGGTVTLQAPNVVIDGATTRAVPTRLDDGADTLLVPAGWLAGSGFGTLALNSVSGGATLTAGTTLVLKQKNYLIDPKAPLPSSGAALRDFAGFGFAPDGLRHAANLTLSQMQYVQGGTDGSATHAPILLDAGSAIVADPGAAITLNALGGAVLLGDVTAHGGSITVAGNSDFTWIGGDASLDVSGTYVADPTDPLYRTGKVLDGGAITLANGSLVVLDGARFDLSGARATVEGPAADGATDRIATRDIWSNGGTLTLSTVGQGLGAHSIWFAGAIDAAGGAPRAAGGTLVIDASGSGNGGVVITQSGDAAAPFAGISAPQDAAAFAALLPAGTASTGYITADTMDSAHSGLDAVALKGSVYFSGDVDLNVTGTLNLMDGFAGTVPGRIGLLPSGTTDTSYVASCDTAEACIPAIGTTVNLSASYVRIDNGLASSLPMAPALGDGTLDIAASTQLDIQGRIAIDYAGNVRLASGGDIRLLYPADPNRNPAIGGIGGGPNVGALMVADDLTLTARTIYPSTDTAFLLMSQGLAPETADGIHNTIAFRSNGKAPVTPYSAGGQLLVDAPAIDQGGALIAPLGTIQLGYGTGQTLPNDLAIFGLSPVLTDTVTLRPGSLTSVSAGGLLIPYGTTTDGGTWTENNTELAAPPSKLILLSGNDVDTQAGAVIDGSGGGDVYATEFVPGTGGTRDVLTTASQTVYALVPGYQGGLAPADPDMTTGVAAGMTVTLDGSKGLPAGTYTLLPAEYATLPGAYRVVVVKPDTGSNATVNQVAADGSTFVTGRVGNAIDGTQSSANTLFEIQSNATWTKYSEIDIARGDDYFTKLAAKGGTVTPRLAADAAQISLAAANALTLNATNRFTPDTGGRGGQLDIAGANLLVVASDLRAAVLASGDYAGYLVLDADQVSGLGIESVLLGGSRVTTGAGVQINATALNTEVATDAAHALTGPEVLLTALAPDSADPNVRGVVVDDGSVITAKGTVSSASNDGLVFGKNPTPELDGQGNVLYYDPGITGDGALLRVSNGGLVTVTRNFVPGVYTSPTATPAAPLPVSSVALGQLTIGDGVAMSGNSLTLDTSGSSSIGASATLTAKNYDLAASVVNVGGGSGGLVVTPDLLAKFAAADVVSLRSASVFNLYDANGLTIGNASNPIGTLVLDGAGLYSQGGKTTINATDLALTDSQAKANRTGGLTGSGGALTLNAADTFSERAGDVLLSGFADVDLSGGKAIRFEGAGTLTTANGTTDVALNAPDVIAAADSRQSLAISGALSVHSTGTAAPVAATEIGGSVAFTAASIDVAGTMTARSGILSLTATDGAITLDGDAKLDAAGSRVTIGPVTQDVAGGTVKLVSTKGDVTLASGSDIDVSGAGNGFAGTLAIATALDRTATLDGTLHGGGAFKDTGGNFTLVTGTLTGDLPLKSGFTRDFHVALYQPGDIDIAAGTTLDAIDVALVANQGNVIVDGTIDASASTGGSIALYGAGVTNAAGVTTGGVTIGSGARLIAAYAGVDKADPNYDNGKSGVVTNGGTITLGTTGWWDGSSLNGDGSELVRSAGSGTISVASGATIDVSAGAGGTGGTVELRAPIITSDDGKGGVNVSFYQGGDDSVTGARAVNLNAYSVWSTADPSAGGTHFDGIIDPAGWFGADGTRIAGDTDATTGIFTPTGTINQDHVTFYQNTLLGFVNDPFGGNDAAVKAQFGSGVRTMLNLKPEIDLYNPDADINKGSITVASTWNFGAGNLDSTGAITLVYRTTDGGEPGSLVLRAANNVLIDATITDGFFLPFNPNGHAVDVPDALTQYDTFVASDAYQAYLSMFDPATGRLVYDASGTLAAFPLLIGFGFEDVGVESPPPTSEASAEYFNISPDVFDSLQFKISAPTIIHGDDLIMKQYDQYYAQYLDMFGAYERETVSVNSQGTSVFGFPGGAYLPYQTYQQIESVFGNAPTQFDIPTMPTTKDAYYNIRNGLGTINFDSSGYASTNAADYVTRWQTYFFDIVNQNMVDSLFLGSLTNYVPNPTLDNTAGLDAQNGLLMGIPVTPPFAPPAYLTQQDGTGIPSDPNSLLPPADRIASNPVMTNGSAVSNATSASALMTQAMGGKGSFSYDFVAGAVFGSNHVASVDPNAMITLADTVDAKSPVDSILIDGHTQYQDPALPFLTQMVTVPTLVRTGTGSITLSAAGDVAFVDPIAQGAVYTAGVAIDTPAGFTPLGYTATKQSTGLIAAPAWGTGGGDVSVAAGQDILGIEMTRDDDFGTYSGIADGATGQTWADWLFHAYASDGDTVPFDSPNTVQGQAWVNYASFFQHFGALAGGNIALNAGRDITDISASLPETLLVTGGTDPDAPPVEHVYGGGDLSVTAGRDLNSGMFLVGRGTGAIAVGGQVQATASNPLTGLATVISTPDSFSPVIDGTTPLPLVLAVQNGYINLVANGDITLGNVFDPTAIPTNISAHESQDSAPGTVQETNVGFGQLFSSYDAESGIALTSISGGVTTNLADIGGGGDDIGLFIHNRDPFQGRFFSGTTQIESLWPASISLTALAGDVDIEGGQGSGGGTQFLSAPAADGGTTGQLALFAGGSIDINTRLARLFQDVDPRGIFTPDPTAATAGQPYSLVAGGDIDFIATQAANGILSIDRPAQIWAGGDIVNIDFVGQNEGADDITSIQAGGDIAARRTLLPNGLLEEGSASIVLYGPGTLLIEAGGDIGPLGTGRSGGGEILSVGDGSSNLGLGLDTGLRAGLSAQGADIVALYGVGPGIDYAAAISNYVDPASAGANGIDYLAIIAKVLGEGRADAWATFQGLSPMRQQLLVDRAYLDFLTQVSTDYNDPTSTYYQKYGRAYDTISTLFPASLGYTDNDTGENNGAATRITTGDMLMARSLVETQLGGDIEIIGPGGNLAVGSNSLDTLTPAQEGILTLQGGAIRTYTDGDVQIFQSRIFTEQGGDIDMFSANGDLNAGKGPKSSTAYPPISLVCDADGVCRVNPTGLVTGAGIGALITVPGQDPADSNVSLTAPHGTVDAGAAGIRVAGDLNIVAKFVANIFNIDVGGKTIGVPTNTVDVSANLDASSTAAAAAQEAVTAMQQARQNERPSIFVVTIDGFGADPAN